MKYIAKLKNLKINEFGIFINFEKKKIYILIWTGIYFEIKNVKNK